MKRGPGAFELHSPPQKVCQTLASPTPPRTRGEPNAARRERLAADLIASAARAHFLLGIDDTVVPTPAPVRRVEGVAVCDVDPVEASAAAHHVGVVGVLVGKHAVGAAPGDDPVVVAVADPLQDPVVALPPRSRARSCTE